MQTPQHPPSPQSPHPAKRGLMDWLFGRPPAPPKRSSTNLYLGDIVGGDFSSPSVHHHHKNPPDQA